MHDHNTTDISPVFKERGDLGPSIPMNAMVVEDGNILFMQPFTAGGKRFQGIKPSGKGHGEGKASKYS